MIRFKQFNEAVVTVPTSIFVKALPVTNSILRIKDRLAPLEQWGQKILEDLHCTVIFSKTPGVVNLPCPDKDERYMALSKEIVFWPGHNGDGYLVLKLHSPDLVNLNKCFQEAGLENSHPEYTPHISLLHPHVQTPEYEDVIKKLNEEMTSSPIVFEFYYGGMSLDEESILEHEHYFDYRGNLGLCMCGAKKLKDKKV